MTGEMVVAVYISMSVHRMGWCGNSIESALNWGSSSYSTCLSSRRWESSVLCQSMVNQCSSDQLQLFVAGQVVRKRRRWHVRWLSRSFDVWVSFWCSNETLAFGLACWGWRPHHCFMITLSHPTTSIMGWQLCFLFFVLWTQYSLVVFLSYKMYWYCISSRHICIYIYYIYVLRIEAPSQPCLHSPRPPHQALSSRQRYKALFRSDQIMRFMAAKHIESVSCHLMNAAPKPQSLGTYPQREAQSREHRPFPMHFDRSEDIGIVLCSRLGRMDSYFPSRDHQLGCF